MALKFAKEDNPIYGTAQKASKLITRVLAPNPSHFTYTGTGTYIVGTDDLAIIDPGPMMIEHGEALLKAINGRHVSAILITHNHIDHSPLSNWLRDKTGAPIMGYGIHTEAKQNEDGKIQLDAGWDQTFDPDKQLRHGDVIKGPDWTIKTIHTPGHTSNHLCFELKEENALFSGDHLMGWSTSVIIPPDGNLRDYLLSLKLLLELNHDIIYPTHGLAIEKPYRYIRATIIHRQMREAQVLRCLERGDNTLTLMVGHMYKDLDKRLHGAAGLSVLSHLIALLEEGKISADRQDHYKAIFSIVHNQ